MILSSAADSAEQRLIFISSTSALSEENSHAVLELHLHIFDE